MSWGTEKTMEAQKMTKHFTAKFIGHGCNVEINRDLLLLKTFDIELQISFVQCLLLLVVKNNKTECL